mmetsp:Transcript_23052/g.48071  ORF Transcript_23052/g.48071 Transcript_23052/m.48071 type:complete len:232 (-) Transcript_23052:106-801(-)
MLLLPVQECTLQAASLISQRKLAQASEILVEIVTSLRERRGEFERAEASQQLNVDDLIFLPLNEDNDADCPDWDDDFFGLPFAVFAPHAGKPVAKYEVTEPIAAACTGVCLFLLGLCYQISAREHERQCPETALKTASSFYNHAWTTLQQVSSNTSCSDTSTTFLLMATATNAATCCYELADLDSANAWFSSLRDILTFCWLKDDHLAMELHNFFLMTSTITTTFVAAGAA